MPGIRDQGHSRWVWRAALAAVLALCGLWVIALIDRTSARAAAADCTPNPCVILIQVDGLEPKDVTPINTPYLWSLAHPPQVAGTGPPGALADRSGFIWQAPRGVVSTGTAAATASLLTGSYAEFTGVPADDFEGLNASQSQARQRLGAGGFGDSDSDPTTDNLSPDGAQPVDSPAVDTIVDAVKNADGEAAVFLGDPALARLAHAKDSDANAFWYPPGTGDSASKADSQFTGDPRLCPIPRYPDSGDSTSGPSTDAWNPSHCPADDGTTLQKAVTDLQQPRSSGVNFTFIHLAELGVAKREAGDPDVDSNNPPPSPPQALADTDGAIAGFVEQYAQNLSSKWARTVLMVVGSHGYQETPLANRVPDPTNADPTHDLSDYVNNFSSEGVARGSLTLVPQGTMATIYYGLDPNVAPAGRATALDKIRTALTEGPVNAACASRNPALGACIEDVYYLKKDDASASQTVAGAHPSWHLDAVDPDNTEHRTGASGDLVVVLGRGWAVGRAAGTPSTAKLEEQPNSNPYTASAGGPQERAVAALVNGPRRQANNPGAVRDLSTLAPGLNYYPVSKQTVDPSDPNHTPSANDPACPDNPPDFGGLACANDPRKVGDDPNAAGHEAQPETVDFAATISALMQLPFDQHLGQLQGRVLQEAFLNPLATPCVGDDCEAPPPPEPEPEPLPPPVAPPVEVVRSRGFDFTGLIRGLKAVVVDSGDHPYAQARPGALLSTIRLEADFGKPKAALTLTFYRVGGGRGRRQLRGSRRVLKAIAHFDPFIVKRGHVKIRLKVPPVFKPDYLGITVREVATGNKANATGTKPCTTVKTRKPSRFRCTGPVMGFVARIADARRLHTRKGRGH